LGIEWEPRQTAWEVGLSQARLYRQQRGDLMVPYDFVAANGFTLGAWIQEQRREHRDGRLLPHRRKALAGIGMAWDSREAAWERGLEAALAYREVHGHLRASEAYVNEAGFALGKWLRDRRDERRCGELSAQRQAALEAIGIDWSLLDHAWETGLAEARAWKKAHKHLRVPKRHVTATGFGLGRWIARNRLVHKQGKLSTERYAALQALGMVWGVVRRGPDRPTAADEQP
jgi:hypothetical protein